MDIGWYTFNIQVKVDPKSTSRLAVLDTIDGYLGKLLREHHGISGILISTGDVDDEGKTLYPQYAAETHYPMG